MEELTDHGTFIAKMWLPEGHPVEHASMEQIRNVGGLPIVHPYVAVMPDVHWGNGTSVGTVIPTRGAIIPAAVGVDLGCGMIAAQTDLDPNALQLAKLRAAIEDAIPVGGPGVKGSWQEPRFGHVPRRVSSLWDEHLGSRWQQLIARHHTLQGVTETQLGTLGTGNHFIEVCIEETTNRVWLMLHSGSRGPGNRIGTYFISRAKEAWEKRADRPQMIDKNLAWLEEGDPLFADYRFAVQWAQDYARTNRNVMMQTLVSHVREHVGHEFEYVIRANCHHNYVQEETHFGERMYITRKGAVSAQAGEYGIIPGSMGARSFIVRGKGNPDAFMSCSHGAGRKMSRGAAKRTITLDEHIAATAGVECRKDEGVLDESPAAYKDIDAVMAAQADLVDVVHILKQIICVKG